MVKAIYNPGIVETTVKVIQEPTITLTLTEREAQAVFSLICRTNGSYLYDIYTSMSEAGVEKFPEVDMLELIPFF